MKPEDQKQFDEELRMVIAVAAQIYPSVIGHQEAVNEAIFLIRDAESKLKEFYEQEKVAQERFRDTQQQIIQQQKFVDALRREGNRGVPGNSEQTPETKPEPPVQAPLQPRPSRKVIEESITAASQVIIAKKLKSQDELLAMLGAYGVKNKSQLNDEQAVKLLEQLKAILK